MKKISAAGGAVYQKEGDKVKLLLIFRNGVWDLPKGKLEEGESVEECAVREVAEEVGVSKPPKIESKLNETIHFYSINGEKIEKVTYWYLMQFDNPESEFIPQTDEGITKVEWHEIDQAKEMVGYENLVQVITEVEKLLK